ncbi:MAG: alpha-L-fucosidase, partial [Armatimonadota bacterium]
GLATMARNLQPGLIIANRTVGDAYEDFITPEHQIPDEPLDSPWESCLVMAENWKYHPRDRYKSTIEIMEMLVDIISKGGNLLLGVGPTPEGEFTPQAIERLEEIGAWFQINGEAVYGTRAKAPYRFGDVRFTAKGDQTYAFVFHRDPFTVPGDMVGEKPSLLGSNGAVERSQEGESVRLIPHSTDLPLPLVYKLS